MFQLIKHPSGLRKRRTPAFNLDLQARETGALRLCSSSCPSGGEPVPPQGPQLNFLEPPLRLCSASEAGSRPSCWMRELQRKEHG